METSCGGGDMKPGDLVGWKCRLEMGIPGDVGMLVERITRACDPFPFWRVLFGDRGMLQCRESDLGVISETG